MPYVNERWLGGMLTNFQTDRTSASRRCSEYERMRDSGEFEPMPKKEAPHAQPRARASSSATSAASATWSKLPDAVFVIDTKKEHIAVTEANKLGIPVVAVVDTNCDPDVIQYVIPGNDDAIRSGNLMCRVIADAVEEGRYIARASAARVAGTRSDAPRRRRGRSTPEQAEAAQRRSSRPRPAARPPPQAARARGPPRPRPRRAAPTAEPSAGAAEPAADAEAAAEPPPPSRGRRADAADRRPTEEAQTDG